MTKVFVLNETFCNDGDFTPYVKVCATKEIAKRLMRERKIYYNENSVLRNNIYLQIGDTPDEDIEYTSKHSVGTDKDIQTQINSDEDFVYTSNEIFYSVTDMYKNVWLDITIEEMNIIEE